MSSVRLLSPAKVNLFLRVLGRRPDGYHEIQSLAQPVSLFDEIAVSVGEGGGVSLSAAGKEVPSGKDNLAAAAAFAYLEEASLEKGVSVAIRKKIPLGAGLGGGSSNAAAVLSGLERLLGELGEENLLRVAARLGADVPFFVKSASSFMEGVGERVEVLPDFPLFHYVIVFPEKSVSTRDVYRRWREPETPPERVDPAALAGEFRSGRFPLENGLEEPLFGLFPEAVSAKELMRSFGAEHVLVSGSGSSVFSVFRERKPAEEIYEYLRTSDDFEVFLAEGVSGRHFLAD